MNILNPDDPKLLDPKLGLINNLIGQWVGTGNGYNIIAVPIPPARNTPEMPGREDNTIVGDGFQLEVQKMNEIITVQFSQQDKAPNKGGQVQVKQQDSYGVEYEIVASEVEHNRLHFENGMWLKLADPPGDDNPYTIVRQASVPHGNAVQLMGTASIKDGKPEIQSVDPTPFHKGGQKVTDANLLNAYQQMKMRFQNVFGPNLDLNKTLKDVIAGQTISKTVTFDISTANNPNGGILNIPFEQEHAKATSWAAKVFVEKLKDNSFQMQYTQTIIIEFGGICYPHIEVNTLRKM